MPQSESDRVIIIGLVKALDWMDNSLQAILEQQGFQSVTRGQSLIIVHIASGLVHPTDIAREMGQSPQNIHQATKPLIAAGIIEQVSNPLDGRSIVYQFAPGSEAIRATALKAFAHLEDVLRERIGDKVVSGLKVALAADWGGKVDNLD